MADEEKLEVERLLAGGLLSGEQHDAIEREVLRQVGEEDAPRRSAGLGWWSGALMSAAAGLLLWFSLREGEAPGPASEGPVAKGAAPGDLWVLEGGCEPRTCRLGDSLVLTLRSDRGGFVSAYATPLGADAATREPIWYFPTANGQQPHVRPSAETQVLPVAVRLAPPHEAGQYRVTAWLSDQPAAARPSAAPPDAARAQFTFAIGPDP